MAKNQISHGIMSGGQRPKFSHITKIYRKFFQGKIDKKHFLDIFMLWQLYAVLMLTEFNSYAFL